MLALTSDQQRRLFKKSFSRKDIAGDCRADAVSLSVSVRRNWALEPTLSIVRRICWDVGIDPNFNIGPYDESFLVDQTSRQADSVLIWPDWNRAWHEAGGRFPDHILDAAASVPNHVILVSPFSGDKALDDFMTLMQAPGALPNVTLVAVDGFRGHQFDRNEQLVIKYGSDVPRNLSILAARSIALQGITSILHQPIKALAVDFDNTLYEGVLGEEGMEGLCFTQSHRVLWGLLEVLRQRGVLLVACSKNDSRDVEALLDSGLLSPLSKTSFIDFRVSWNSKAEAIRDSAEALGIGTSAFGLLDDNPAERRLVELSNLGVYLLDAADTEQVVAALLHGPNISTRLDQGGSIRESDLRARRERDRIQTADVSIVDLHTFLKTDVRVSLASRHQLGRVHELLRKTNQFNVALERTSLDKVAAALESASSDIVVASVRDRYSDSGLVATLIVDFEASHVEVKEFAISCRVLGRGLESGLFWSMLSASKALRDDSSQCPVAVRYSRGPRNDPAVEWLEFEAGKPLGMSGLVVLPEVPRGHPDGIYPFIHFAEEVEDHA